MTKFGSPNHPFGKNRRRAPQKPRHNGEPESGQPQGAAPETPEMDAPEIPEINGGSNVPEPLPKTKTPTEKKKLQRITIDQSLIEVVEGYTRNTSAYLFCNGLTKAQDAQIEEILRETPTGDAIKNAVDTAHTDVANQLFRGSKHAIDPNPPKYGTGAPIKDIPWLQKTGLTPETEKVLNGQSRTIATLIEMNQKTEPGQTEIQKLRAANDRVGLQAKKVRNTIHEAENPFVAGMQIAWSTWNLKAQKDAGKITEEEYKTKSNTLKEDLSILLNMGGSASARNLRSSQRDSFAAINELVENDEKRKKLSEIAGQMRKNPNDMRVEAEGLSYFSRDLQTTYRSQTMSNSERREFWKSVEQLTEKPLTPTNGLKLMSLEMSQITRENAEMSVQEAHTLNSDSEQKLERQRRVDEDEKQRADRKRKEEENEARQNRRELEGTIDRAGQTLRSGLDKTGQHAVEGLKISDRG